MVQLINPETHAFVDVPQMTYPVRYVVPLTSVGHQQYHYEVRLNILNHKIIKKYLAIFVQIILIQISLYG